MRGLQNVIVNWGGLESEADQDSSATLVGLYPQKFAADEAWIALSLRSSQ